MLWLLLALVLVPSLGRLHQVIHGGALDRVHTGHALAAVEPDPVADSTGDHDGLLLRSLPTHHQPADCLVLDQLALGDALHLSSTALPPLLPAQAPAACPVGGIGAQHVALFHARGPPAA